MNRSFAALVALLALSMPQAHAQKKTFASGTLSAFFAPAYTCPAARECVIPVEVVAPLNGANCQAKFPIEVHIPRGLAGIRLIWSLNLPIDAGFYKFDSNYGIEVLTDRDRQMLPGAPRSDTEWYAVDRNSVTLATADYLPHVLRADNENSKFVPCDVVDPRIIND